MKLAAFYIPSGYQPNIFGENHQEMTINLGGKFLYKLSNGTVTSAVENPYHLDDLLSRNISLFSCIVGNNGGGKTTLLNLIGNAYNCKYVVENNYGSYEVRDHIEDIHRIYYTPYLHHTTFEAVRNNFKDLSKFTLISLDNHGDSGQLQDFLEAHHSENTKRWIGFNHFYITKEIQGLKLPVFDEVKIKLNHFENTVYSPEHFHDTSYQLRQPIIQLFHKIKAEQEQVEESAGTGKELSQAEAIKISNLIRFQYDLYETLLGKLVSVLERCGNRFLNEGYISENYLEKFENLNVREALEWFFDNAGVEIGINKYSFGSHKIGLKLVDYILTLVSNEHITDNWRIISVNEYEANKIIELYDKFNESFINNWFEYDRSPMFTFMPQIILSSGEQGLLNLFSTLYYHSRNIENHVDHDYHSSDSLDYIRENIMLLLDEGDNAFHPQWKKEYVNMLRNVVPIIFPQKNVQIIITSHDPLTLSDFPKHNVIYLERTSDTTRISKSHNKRTFGANISDLLKDSFFIEDGQIGSFSASLIDNMILRIRRGNLPSHAIDDFQRIIKCIDEPILKFKLAEMLSEATDGGNFERKLIDDEIARLSERRGRI